MKTPEQIQSHRRAVAKWDSNHRDRHRARQAVYFAIYCGILFREPCEICGESNDVEGHHDSYEDPLKVKWLCPEHHALRHLDLRENKKKQFIEYINFLTGKTYTKKDFVKLKKKNLEAWENFNVNA